MSTGRWATSIGAVAESWWLGEQAPPLRSTRLDDPVDVAIVGAGVTGCSCALTLARG
ncbi:MAG: hypothetical protein QOE95_1061, partial [Gaiellaceae bacterium]|nr:hypothetical protein [Gaiellaceae bacterium]